MRLLLLLCAGCMAGVPVRNAEVQRPGEIALVASLTVFSFGAGSTQLTLHQQGAPEPHRVTGNSGPRFLAPMEIMLFGFYITMEVGLAVGLGGGCEAGGSLSLLRLGAELRCAPVREADGDPLSLAGSAAVGWQPFFGRGFSWRVGIDASERLDDFFTLGSVYLTSGPESHAMMLPREASSYRPHAFGWLRAPRRELRLSGVVGIGSGDDVGNAGQLGLVFYRALRAAEVQPSCHDCSPAAEIDGFDELWGMHVVLGGTMRP